MTIYSAEATTLAPRDQVWQALVDVTDWPRWTPSYTSIKRLDDGPLAVGSRARVKQPRLAPSIVEVTELDAGRGFTWVSSSVGVRFVGRHRLVPEPGGGTRIDLVAELSGRLAGTVKLLLGRRIQQYVRLEANGIKAAAEAAGSREDGP
jgi:uncharacterized membrane protein